MAEILCGKPPGGGGSVGGHADDEVGEAGEVEGVDGHLGDVESGEGNVEFGLLGVSTLHLGPLP